MTKPCETWMPFYLKDFDQDTAHLSAAEVGAYMRLLIRYWADGPLPDDDRRLASICRMGTDEWGEIAPTIRRFFRLKDDGLLHQKRADLELARATHKKQQITRPGLSEKRSEAGRKGGTAKAGTSRLPAVCQDFASRLPGFCQDFASDLLDLKESENSDLASKPIAPLPVQVQVEEKEEKSTPSLGFPTQPDSLPLEAAVTVEASTGKRCVGGWYLDEVFALALEAAGIPEGSRVNERPVIGWLRDGYEPDPICDLIRNRAKWKGYSPPCSLAFFDRMIRAQPPPESELDRNKRLRENKRRREQSIVAEQKARKVAEEKAAAERRAQWLAQKRAKPEHAGKSDEQIEAEESERIWAAMRETQNTDWRTAPVTGSA